jgi:hypothetical protein
LAPSARFLPSRPRRQLAGKHTGRSTTQGKQPSTVVNGGASTEAPPLQITGNRRCFVESDDESTERNDPSTESDDQSLQSDDRSSKSTMSRLNVTIHRWKATINRCKVTINRRNRRLIVEIDDSLTICVNESSPIIDSSSKSDD